MSALAANSAEVRTPAPPPAAPESLTTPEHFAHIAVEHIDPSPTNFRKAFDESALEELSQSILIKGVVEPIIVRPKLSPLAKNKREQAIVDGLRLDSPRYELVAGERRWRATKLAGLKTIPAIVRQYSDKAALEVQIIENDQRADISPMERARGFQMMLDRLGYSADEIAQKLHKSKTFVYSHLKLANLPKLAAESLEIGPEGGGISRSVAELIARIPDEKMREKAAQELVRGYANSGPMTYRDARAYVERCFMKELKGAPFDQGDATLVPAAGPCTSCQHCTANTPDQYQGKRTDMCLLPQCFAKKVEAHHTQALTKFREAGHTIIPTSEAREMFKHSDSYISGNSKYEIISNACYTDSKQRSNRQILGRDYKSIVAQTPRGTVVELCLKADVRKALDEGKPKGTKQSPARSARDNREDPEVALMERAVLAAAGRLVEKIEAGDGTLPAELLRWLVKERLDGVYGDDLERVFGRRGIACEEGDEDEAIEKLLPAMGTKHLLGLLVEMIFLSPYWGRELAGEQAELLKIFGIDFKPIIAAEKKRRDEWQQKLKTATTAVRLRVEFAASRLQPGGDVHDAYSADRIAYSKTIKTFEYEGERFTQTGNVINGRAAATGYEAVRVVQRSAYKGKTHKYPGPNSNTDLFYEGTLVQCGGEECVLTGPRLECVPVVAKAASPKAAAAKKPAAKTAAKKAARAAAGRRA